MDHRTSLPGPGAGGRRVGPGGRESVPSLRSEEGSVLVAPPAPAVLDGAPGSLYLHMKQQFSKRVARFGLGCEWGWEAGCLAPRLTLQPAPTP